jgi:pimeloyl-ACP methyl ester carboxylesterase
MNTNFLIKILLSGLGIAVIVYIIVCLGLFWGQNRLIFRPIAKLANTPDSLGLDYQEVWIPVKPWRGKTEKLHAWWLPGQMGDDKVMLYLHGNGGNISYNLTALQAFNKLGFSTLIIDYRGYGRSEGDFPSEAEVYRDAQSAWDYLLKNRGIKPENIFIYGHSLGGAIAIDLAVRKPQAAAVITDGTFTSMRALVDRIPLYRFFPTDLILHQHFDSLNKLKLLRMPLLLIHGNRDQDIPAVMSQVLYDKATVPKKLLILPKAAHHDLIRAGGETYLQTLADFVRAVRNNPRPLAKP